MKKHNDILRESLRYACIILTGVFGFVFILGTGGGGGGSGSSSTPQQPTNRNLITSTTAPQIASAIGKMTTGVEGVLFASTLDFGSGAYSPKSLLKHVNNGIRNKGNFSSGSDLPKRLLATVSITEDCSNGGSITTMISLDGSVVLTDLCDVVDPTLDFIFEDCQEDFETINGTVGMSLTGTLCQETPPEFSIYFTDFAFQNQDDDSDFVLDITMDFSDIQYDSFDNKVGMYLALDGDIYGTFEGDSIDLTYDNWVMTFSDMGYDLYNEITGLYLSFDGSFSGSIDGDSFDEAYEDMVLTFQNTTIDAIAGILLTVNGSYNGGCLDEWISVETLDPLFIPDSGDSPTSGQIRLSGSGEATIIFESDGGITISVDGDELKYSDYDDLPSCI